MEFETPTQLANRLKVGREEFCQRLLTSLILQAPYPRWNTRSAPSVPGLRFLRDMWALTGFGDWPGDEDAVFVDELELVGRTEAEKGGAPDYAVLWDDRVWIIELKTERASHRADQIPSYFELGHHHYPDAKIDITYLTSEMTYEYEAPGPWGRYSHLTWHDVAPAIRANWPHGTASGEQEVVDGLLDAIDRMESTKPSEFLDSVRTLAGRDDQRNVLAEALALAELTAADGEQRALDFEAADLEDLLALRLDVRNELANAPTGSPLRTVMPWLWRPASTGAPMTNAGNRPRTPLLPLQDRPVLTAHQPASDSRLGRTVIKAWRSPPEEPAQGHRAGLSQRGELRGDTLPVHFEPRTDRPSVADVREDLTRMLHRLVEAVGARANPTRAGTTRSKALAMKSQTVQLPTKSMGHFVWRAGGSEQLGEIVNQLATMSRLHDALTWVSQARAAAWVVHCNPTTSNVGSDLEVHDKFDPPWSFEVSDTLAKNANRKINKDIASLLRLPAEHRRLLVTSGVNSSYRPKGESLTLAATLSPSPTGATVDDPPATDPDYYTTVIMEVQGSNQSANLPVASTSDEGETS